ncbi:hypothetical protein F3Y22_tig00111336pilonHSYRG00013 [Hibiscus syriacus]|uniref:Uncharacterized protein n=1 Tax=Hibiscus syriacus TaxID=106335 RepID=A0A6A2YPD1_HIBSY|nr:hypothetical protein F3Y22_tig00111336pilonHSYRG00013 [Hibiscus syriacus]
MDSDLIHDLYSDMILDLNYVLIFDISVYGWNMFYWGVLLEEDYLEVPRLCAQGLTYRFLGCVLRALLLVTGLYGSGEPTHFVRDGWGHPKYFSETKAHCPLPPEISVKRIVPVHLSTSVREFFRCCCRVCFKIFAIFTMGRSGGPNVTSWIGSGYPHRSRDYNGGEDVAKEDEVKKTTEKLEANESDYLYSSDLGEYGARMIRKAMSAHATSKEKNDSSPLA